MLFPFHDENPTTRAPVVTVGLIVINVLCLFYMGNVQRTQGELALRAFIHEYGFIPLRMKQLFEPKALRVDLIPEAGRIPLGNFPLGMAPNIPKRFLDLPPSKGQIIRSWFTAVFLHANLLHLLGNMWFLWLFGNNVEDRLGHVGFLGFYLLGGLFASAVHWAMSPAEALRQPVIGASGAVAATLGAYAVTYPFARIKTLLFIVIFFTVIELPALVVLGGWFLLQLLNVFQPPIVGVSVAWWAHIGGFVAGAVLMPLLTGPTTNSSSDTWQDDFER